MEQTIDLSIILILELSFILVFIHNSMCIFIKYMIGNSLVRVLYHD